jgi:hypothetical protein
MLNFVRKAFRKFVEIWLWLNLIVCTAGGGVVFYFTVAQVRSYNSWGGRSSSSVNGGLIFLGVLIGLVVGLITNILFGGLISTFLNIDDNLENMRSNLNKLSSRSPISPIKEEKKCKKCGKSFDSGYSSCPHCGSSEFV